MKVILRFFIVAVLGMGFLACEVPVKPSLNRDLISRGWEIKEIDFPLPEGQENWKIIYSLLGPIASELQYRFHEGDALLFMERNRFLFQPGDKGLSRYLADWELKQGNIVLTLPEKSLNTWQGNLQKAHWFFKVEDHRTPPMVLDVVSVSESKMVLRFTYLYSIPTSQIERIKLKLNILKMEGKLDSSVKELFDRLFEKGDVISFHYTLEHKEDLGPFTD